MKGSVRYLENENIKIQCNFFNVLKLVDTDTILYIYNGKKEKFECHDTLWFEKENIWPFEGQSVYI